MQKSKLRAADPVVHLPIRVPVFTLDLLFYPEDGDSTLLRNVGKYTYQNTRQVPEPLPVVISVRPNLRINTTQGTDIDIKISNLKAQGLP
jgi:hypothetical protein